jgi:hypothetical protein
MEHAYKLAPTKGYKDPINKKPPWPYLVNVMFHAFFFFFSNVLHKYI